MATLRAAFFAALLSCLCALAAFAQDVTLTSLNDELTVSGELLGFDGEFYRVETIYGELTVDSSGVICEGSGCPDLSPYVAEITLSGAASIGQVLLPALIEAFALREGLEAMRDKGPANAFSYSLIDPATQQPGGRFHLKLSNTDEGFADQLAGETDIVMSQREVTPEEVVRGHDAGLGDLTETRRSRVLALDALVPMVSPKNPVTRIAMDELAKVLTGEITDWEQLGGAGGAITLHLLDPTTGLGQLTQQRLLGSEVQDFAQGAIRHTNGAALSQAVADDPLALGIANRSEMGEAFELALAGACGFTMQASDRAIKAEDYPLTAPMFLYLPAHRLPKLAREFLAFTREPAAHLVVRRAGFVDQLPEEITINDQGQRFANAILRAGNEVTLNDLQRMIRFLRPLKRLTTTFRFAPDTSGLNAQSRSNIQALARALESGLYDGRELVFVGFSDSEGSARANPSIARQRAISVRDAVIGAAENAAQLDHLQTDIRAFGEALPMACDHSEWGRRANRRVEIWVR